MNAPRTLALLALLFVSCGEAATTRAAEGLPLGTPGTLPIESIRRMAERKELHETFVPEAPVGLPADLSTFVPAANPLTRAKVELGMQLFFDARLSKDGTLACASCHHPSRGWTDGAQVAVGNGGQKGRRNAPTIANRLLGTTQTWDGHARSLEQQAMEEIASSTVMGFSLDEAAHRLNEVEGYRVQFDKVFGGPVTGDLIGKAIAAFERTILSGNSKNDVYERALPFLDREPEDGDSSEFRDSMREALNAEAKKRLSEAARRGRELFFGRAKCNACHAGPDLTDGRFHNLGIGMQAKQPDLGRYAVTKAEGDRGAFRTPTLRDVARTAPYMHDGSLKTLREAVEHHLRGGTPNPALSAELVRVELAPAELQDLLTFLEEGLSGETTPVEIPSLP